MVLPLPRYLNPKADVVFKKIFGARPHLLKSFLNAVLSPAIDHPIIDLTYLSTKKTLQIPNFKQTIADVKCTDTEGRVFIVKIQINWNDNFKQQLSFTSRQFPLSYPVYELTLVAHAYQKASSTWYHHYQRTQKDQLNNKIHEHRIFIELPKVPAQLTSEHQLKLLWLRFFREINKKTTSVAQELMDIPEINEALKLAEEDNYSSEELTAYASYWTKVKAEKISTQNNCAIIQQPHAPIIETTLSIASIPVSLILSTILYFSTNKAINPLIVFVAPLPCVSLAAFGLTKIIKPSTPIPKEYAKVIPLLIFFTATLSLLTITLIASSAENIKLSQSLHNKTDADLATVDAVGAFMGAGCSTAIALLNCLLIRKLTYTPINQLAIEINQLKNQIANLTSIKLVMVSMMTLSIILIALAIVDLNIALSTTHNYRKEISELRALGAFMGSIVTAAPPILLNQTFGITFFSCKKKTYAHLSTENSEPNYSPFDLSQTPAHDAGALEESESFGMQNV